ncbi:unnamed protein product [Paramecium octaurelia]|uniref:Uncharacterized protein n=1 Tax=Paramecium octaurelia TaxID=43137 RepID=A0A8S1YLS6_PAROT|nr:unnamed protein product [Paramecium octaurelia]
MVQEISDALAKFTYKRKLKFFVTANQLFFIIAK